MTAGFCWEWSKHNSDHALNDDVVIGNYKRPWNARHEAVRLPKGVPKAQFWAHDPNGIEQIGCVYTAQGFEFDYVGVIFGNDISYSFEDGKWTGHPGNSKDPVVRGAKGKFSDLVKNTYRVLFSRGLKGCYVYFLDKDTEKFFRSRMDIPTSASQKTREEQIQPYVNALPLVRIQDLENMSFSDWRAQLEEGWRGEHMRLAGGPFLHDRFLVRAEDASILRWAELSEKLARQSVTSGQVLALLLEEPSPVRNVYDAIQLFQNSEDASCIWTGERLQQRGFDIDHAIPFSLWHNNDLWNLFPVKSSINQLKKDKLPSRRFLITRKNAIVDIWEKYSITYPERFRSEADTFAGQLLLKTDCWPDRLFSVFAEAIEITAIQRGSERWEP
jgi:hypothetical protein